MTHYCLSALILSLMGLTGCTAPTVRADGFDVEKRAYEFCMSDLKARAPIDLDCDPAKVSIKVISVFDYRPPAARTFAASGCDKTAVYTFVPKAQALVRQK